MNNKSVVGTWSQQTDKIGVVLCSDASLPSAITPFDYVNDKKWTYPQVRTISTPPARLQLNENAVVISPSPSVEEGFAQKNFQRPDIATILMKTDTDGAKYSQNPPLGDISTNVESWRRERSSAGMSSPWPWRFRRPRLRRAEVGKITQTTGARRPRAPRAVD